MNFKTKPRKQTNWRGKKITLMGLGVSGGGVQDALFFIKNGAQVTITDPKTKRELKPSVQRINQFLLTTGSLRHPVVEWVLGKHREKDFINADLIIKNPDVPNDSKFLQIAKKNKIPIYTSAEIFFEIVNLDKLIGVSGTKGKSTVVSLIFEILKLKYPNSYMAGLPGMGMLGQVDKIKNNWGVVELSSWQLEGIKSKKSPHIAVITNIEQDHLNRHKSFKNYTEAKKIIFKYQTGKDYLIINENLKDVVGKTSSQIRPFSAIGVPGTPIVAGIYEENINAALEVAEILSINKKDALRAIKDFKGLPGRLELIDTINGIKIYNDTTATNPYATLAALKKFSAEGGFASGGKNKKIALIVGGEDKNLDYAELAKKLPMLHFVALLGGSASDKIYSYNTQHGTWNRTFVKTENLSEALEKSVESKPEVILFSPAAASFNMFANEFERGKEFNKVVKNFKNKLK